MITLSGSRKLSSMSYSALLAERTGLLGAAMSSRNPVQVHACAAEIAVLNAEVRLRGRQSGARRPIRSL